MALQAGFFVAPVIYPLGILPERFHAYLYLWPPTPLIEFSRDVLVRRAVPSLTGHVLLAVAVTLCADCRHHRPSPAGATGRRVSLRARVPVIDVEAVSKGFSDPDRAAQHGARARARAAAAAAVRAAGGARRRELLGAPRRGTRDHGAQRRWQEHPAQDPVRHLPTRRWTRRPPRRYHACPGARRRLEPGARRARQRVPDRVGDGADPARHPPPDGPRSSTLRSSSHSPISS